MAANEQLLVDHMGYASRSSLGPFDEGSDGDGSMLDDDSEDVATKAERKPTLESMPLGGSSTPDQTGTGMQQLSAADIGYLVHQNRILMKHL